MGNRMQVIVWPRGGGTLPPWSTDASMGGFGDRKWESLCLMVTVFPMKYEVLELHHILDRVTQNKGKISLCASPFKVRTMCINIQMGTVATKTLNCKIHCNRRTMAFLSKLRLVNTWTKWTVSCFEGNVSKRGQWPRGKRECWQRIHESFPSSFLFLSTITFILLEVIITQWKDSPRTLNLRLISRDGEGEGLIVWFYRLTLTLES